MLALVGERDREKVYRQFVEAGVAEDDTEFLEAMRLSARSIGSEEFRTEVDERHAAHRSERRFHCHLPDYPGGTGLEEGQGPVQSHCQTGESMESITLFAIRRTDPSSDSGPTLHPTAKATTVVANALRSS
jgi:hypothetical protein